jgi:hypothetical protein
MRLKFVATVLAAVIATFSVTVSASANDQQQRGVGILPFLAGPVAAGALVGTSTTNWSHELWFKFYKNQGWGWKKIHALKNAGYDVTKYYKHGKIKVHAEKHRSWKSSSAQGKVIVGCIMGSALGAITASIRKASAMGNPPRWRSQAEHEAIVRSGYEKQFELTNDEAHTAIALCGLGSFALNWQKAPVVTARY